MRIKHSHIRLTGLSIEGLYDPDNPEDPHSYGPDPIRVWPMPDSDEYLEDIVIAPHGVGYGAHSLIRVVRTKNLEIGPLKVIGIAGASWILPNEQDRHAGEIVYLGSPPSLVFDEIEPVVDDFPWSGEIDETRNVHIHHIDNSGAHPHSQLVDAKLGTRNVLIEYCTDAGGSQNTEPYPADAVALRSYNTTFRKNDIRNGEGNGIVVQGVNPVERSVLEDLSLEADRIGTENEIYQNFVGGFENEDIWFQFADPADQNVLCGNELVAPHYPEFVNSCGDTVPQSDEIAHDHRQLSERDGPDFAHLQFDFNRTVQPSEWDPPREDDRHLAVMAHELTFLDDSRSEIFQIDVGGEESDTIFGTGAYGGTEYDGEPSRWFGGPNAEAEMFVPVSDIQGAAYCRIRGWPVEANLSVDIFLGEEFLETVRFPEEGMQAHTIAL